MKVFDIVESPSDQFSNQPRTQRYVERVFKARLHEFRIFGQYIAKKYPDLNWDIDPWMEIGGWSSTSMRGTLALRPNEKAIITSTEDQNKYNVKLNNLIKANDAKNAINESSVETDEWSNNPITARNIQRVFRARVREFEIFGDHLGEKYPALKWSSTPWAAAGLQHFRWKNMCDHLPLQRLEMKIISKDDQAKYNARLSRLLDARRQLEKEAVLP